MASFYCRQKKIMPSAFFWTDSTASDTKSGSEAQTGDAYSKHDLITEQYFFYYSRKVQITFEVPIQWEVHLFLLSTMPPRMSKTLSVFSLIRSRSEHYRKG